jgi:hypothetical protein
MERSESRPQERVLFCFDFDLTLTHQHLYQQVAQMILGGVSRERACMRAIQHLEERGARGGDQLWEVLTSLLVQGHGLAVCTFSAFPELPMSLLQRGAKELRARGARREHTGWLTRPIVTYGDPNPSLRPKLLTKGAYLVHLPSEQMGEVGKRLHIERALELANERLSRSLNAQGQAGVIPVCPTPYGDPQQPFTQVVLIDDDQRNVELAITDGYEAILAAHPESGDDSFLEALLAYA